MIIILTTDEIVRLSPGIARQIQGAIQISTRFLYVRHGWPGGDFSRVAKVIIVKIHPTLLVVLHGCPIVVSVAHDNLLWILADRLLRLPLFSVIVFGEIHLSELMLQISSIKRRVDDACACLLVGSHDIRHLLWQVDAVLCEFVLQAGVGSGRSFPLLLLPSDDIVNISLLDGHVRLLIASACLAIVCLVVAPVHLVQVLLVPFDVVISLFQVFLVVLCVVSDRQIGALPHGRER